MKLDLNTSTSEKIYILGAGAIGMALAVNLLRNGRSVAAVRTSHSNYAWETVQVSVKCDQNLTIEAPLEMVSLSKLDRLSAGTIVITAKATANRFLASELRDKKSSGPIVIMQNGIGVESHLSRRGFLISTDVSCTPPVRSNSRTSFGSGRWPPHPSGP